MTKRRDRAVALLALLGTLVALPAGAGENPLFGYTHMLPSPFTLPAGRLVVGSDVALGITDFLQVGTNVIYDFYKILNLNLKASILDEPEFALALTFGWSRYNYNNISPSNPDLLVTSIHPGGVAAFAILPNLALFTGGFLNYTSTALLTSGVQTSGFVRGATLEGDLSYAYGSKGKKASGNVVSGGLSYDLNYKILGIGVSHHWPGFHIGFHYYPNADQYRLEPILAGGGSFEI